MSVLNLRTRPEQCTVVETRRVVVDDEDELGSQDAIDPTPKRERKTYRDIDGRNSAAGRKSEWATEREGERRR